MAEDLAQLLREAMERQEISAQALSFRTGIRLPRVRALLEDGTRGPIRPTTQELADLAAALALPPGRVLGSPVPKAS